MELTVAPALLSLVLRQLNERRLARGPDAKITPDLLDLEQEKILEDFYLQTLKDVPAGVRIFVEDKLLTASGHRNSCALDDALAQPAVTQPILDTLVDRRLLAYEDRHHTRRVELTHDVLLPVIRTSRDARLTTEAIAETERLRARQATQRRKQRLTAALALALAITLLATIWGTYSAFVQEHKAYYRAWSKQNGFPVGVDPISKAEARKQPVSYLLIQKGVTRRGWKLRHKPAFRVIALNGLLEPTTWHGVTTYLWKGSFEANTAKGDQPNEKGRRLGLQMVCQWEFVSTATGEIIYERGLDRDGRMMYGLIYSPPGSGPPGTRLARFVGADGFPQLQRSSSAEYVQLHYDNDGREDRVTFRDGKNLPAAGPFGAFGQDMRYNSRGQITRLLSLDANGQPMLDDAGNCGLIATFNAKGWEIEARSVGPDLKQMPLKDGWVINRFQYDEIGRLRLITYYDAAGRPVLHKNGYHGWKPVYDDHGNQIAATFVGLDGKPTLLADGYSTWKASYDAHGRMIRVSYYGVGGEPVLHRDGNHAWEAQLDEHGNQTTLRFLGLDAKPTSISGGYSMVKQTYDDRGRVVQTRLYGVAGEPVFQKDGYHGWRAQYDDRGNQIMITYFGPDEKASSLPAGYATLKKIFDSDGHELEVAYFDAAGKPAIDKNTGFHRSVSVYDARGKITRNSYYSVSGEPALHKNGYHAWAAQYDGRGNQTVLTYLGMDGKPTILGDGYATLRMAYDARGKIIRKSYEGVNGEPVLQKDGSHGAEMQYDELGNETVAIYLGLDGRPITLPAGYAIVRWAYDAHGRISSTSYYGANNEPVLYTTYHRWDMQYDERGNVCVMAYFGVDGKPILQPDGYASTKWIYTGGNLTRLSYYGVNGEPVLHRSGNHGLKMDYDERGNQTAVTYFGLNGKPVLMSTGLATIKSEYDGRNRRTKQTYFGVDGEPVLHRSGNHGLKMDYDERGNQTAVTYFGLDGKPVLITTGLATIKSEYDGRNWCTKQTYYGVRGEPVLHRDGNHGWEAEYDERGNKVATTYFGLDGKPTLLADGFATKRLAYDADGRVTRTSYLGVSGEPVLNHDGYHALEERYDDKGGERETTYVGLDGRPVLNRLVGFASKETVSVSPGVTKKSYYDPDGALINGPEGFAEVQQRRREDGTLLEEAFFGAGREPRPGPGGYHLMKRELGSTGDVVKYFDVDNHILRSLGSESLVPVIFVTELDGLEQPAAKTGVEVGDVLWRYGDWSVVESLERARHTERKLEDIARRIEESFLAERTRLSDSPVPMTVLRDDQSVTLLMPPLPEKVMGMIIQTRSIPFSLYKKLKKNFAVPRSPGKAAPRQGLKPRPEGETAFSSFPRVRGALVMKNAAR